MSSVSRDISGLIEVEGEFLKAGHRRMRIEDWTPTIQCCFEYKNVLGPKVLAGLGLWYVQCLPLHSQKTTWLKREIRTGHVLLPVKHSIQ